MKSQRHSPRSQNIPAYSIPVLHCLKERAFLQTVKIRKTSYLGQTLSKEKYVLPELMIAGMF